MEISDEALIAELDRRLGEKNRAFADLLAATRKLELVNKKLQDSERLKSNFLSNIRNEINNPMTSLVALSRELSSMRMKDEGKRMQVAEMVYSEALCLEFQMRNIFMAADLEAGEAELDVSKVDLNSLLDSAIESLTPLMNEHDVKLIRRGDSNFFINTDYDKLYIAVSNLINNGIIFNKAGGLLHISYDKSNGGFSVSVKDEGIGIASHNFKLVFDRFKQLNAGVRKKYRGHGLGLSVAQAVAGFLGGRITVFSSEGKGSTFKLKGLNRKIKETDFVSEAGAELFFDNGAV